MKEIRFKEISANEIAQVAELQKDLIHYILEETQDDYFQIDNLLTHKLQHELESSLRDNSKKIYVALHNHLVIGFISGEIISSFLPYLNSGKIGYVSAAYVIPSYREKGVLKTLENLLLGYFKKHDLKYVELNVLIQNKSGKNAWNSLGYTTFREHMRKKLP